MSDVEQNVRTRMKTRVGPISAEVARTIVERCLNSKLAQVMAGDLASLCSGDQIPIFVTGGDVWEASAHDQQAIAGHASWATLNYGPNNYPPAWYKQVQYGQPCIPNGKVENCHEYPYYSTTQAGPGASVDHIDATQNQDQGRLYLTAFYGRQCHVPIGGRFGVLPVPVEGVPSGGICP